MSPTDTVKRTVEIPRIEYERFRERHPGHGDFIWFLREALRLYNDLNEVKPEELIQTAVSEITLR